MKITQITRYQKDQTVHSTKFQNLNLISWHLHNFISHQLTVTMTIGIIKEKWIIKSVTSILWKGIRKEKVNTMPPQIVRFWGCKGGGGLVCYNQSLLWKERGRACHSQISFKAENVRFFCKNVNKKIYNRDLYGMEIFYSIHVRLLFFPPNHF